MSLKCDSQFPTLGKINIFKQNTRESHIFSSTCAVILFMLNICMLCIPSNTKAIAATYRLVTKFTIVILIISGILYGTCIMVILNYVCIFLAFFAGLQDSKAHVFAIDMIITNAVQVLLMVGQTYNARLTDFGFALLTCERASLYICMALFNKNVPVCLAIIVNCVAIARACISFYIYLCLFNYSQIMALAITIFGVVFFVGWGIFCGIICVKGMCMSCFIHKHNITKTSFDGDFHFFPIAPICENCEIKKKSCDDS